LDIRKLRERSSIIIWYTIFVKKPFGGDLEKLGLRNLEMCVIIPEGPIVLNSSGMESIDKLVYAAVGISSNLGSFAFL
jgi:hypothetical protein